MNSSATSKGIFVTGTDTGIGKTYVSRLLVECFAQRFSVTYMKPVQTGCSTNAEGALVAPDLDFVAQSESFRQNDLSDHAPYRFVPACSPHLASREAGGRISIDRILQAYNRLASSAEMVVAEGAGGVCVPLNEKETMLDLMKALALPVVVVTSPRLGTLNHTFLTVQALIREDLTVAGIVYNNADNLTKDFIYQDNRATLDARLPSIRLVELDYNSRISQPLKELCHEIA